MLPNIATAAIVFTVRWVGSQVQAVTAVHRVVSAPIVLLDPLAIAPPAPVVTNQTLFSRPKAACDASLIIIVRVVNAGAVQCIRHLRRMLGCVCVTMATSRVLILKYVKMSMSVPVLETMGFANLVST
jgi:hypothetical protein